MTVTLDRPAVLLRVEALALLLVSLLLYRHLGASRLLFGIAFLVPDLAMLGYLAGNRIGALGYNLLHNYTLPAGLAIVGLLAGGSTLPVALALIWLAHITLDRALGFGLKYHDGFQHTHLARV
ncbi:MAG: DUF4260 domain-containing protein [Chloroflexaceae bacterium]